MKNILLLALTSTLLFGCAKVRETNRPGDANADRIEKTMFTGLKAEKSNDIRSYEDTFKDGKVNTNSGALWLHKVTVVNTSANGGFTFIGYQGALKAGYFVFSRENMQFRSAVNNRISPDPGRYDDLIYEWPIEHSEFRFNEIDGRTTNSLVENDFEKWENKDYFRLNFAKQNIGQNAYFPYSAPNKRCWEEKSAEVIDESRQLSNDYMSYVVRKAFELNLACAGIRDSVRGNFTYQVDYLFSFKRLNEDDVNYEPIVYNSELDPLFQKYGYFTTAYEDLGVDPLSREVKEYANRFNPKKLTHTFYFAPGFPEKYKWIYKTDPNKKDPQGQPVIGVFDRTNEVLEDAYNKAKAKMWPELLKKHSSLNEDQVLQLYPEMKQPMRFEVVDAPEGVLFGDLRYSFIKYITEVEPSSPLGYGPSDGNPFTGEIISANSMVWTGYLNYYVRRLAKEIDRSGAEEGSDLQIYLEMIDVMGGDPQNIGETLKEWADTSSIIQPETQFGQKFKKMLPGLLYTPPFFAKYTNEINYDKDGNAIYPIDYPQLYNFKDLSVTKSKYGSILEYGVLENLERIQLNAKEYVEGMMKFNKNDLNIYDYKGTLEGVPDLLESMTPEQVIDTILYRVSVHEFGHNVGLRHNFFGSVDKSNFAQDQEITLAKADGTTETKTYPQTSSSVMDYLNIGGEVHSLYDWEAYDKAALSFLYTSGVVDHADEVYPVGHALEGQKKHFLYCTDEHRFTNAMCNAYDLGSTPTEIVMSMIDNFQKGYWTRNRRFGRPYWDTSSYEGSVFGSLWDIKRFVLFDQDSFTQYNSKIKDLFKSVNADSREQEAIMEFVKTDLSRAIKLSVAFYYAILQQNGAERNYYSLYDEPTGTLLRKGTSADKFYAAYMLLGDDGFLYNPNSPSPIATYLSYYNDPDVVTALEEVSLDLLINRVEAVPGFITFNRLLFTQNVTNYVNRDANILKRRMKMTCYRPETFKDLFGIDARRYKYETNNFETQLVADILNIETELPLTPNANFNATEFSLKLGDIGFAFVDESYVYVASKSENDIAFSVIENLYNEYARGDGSGADSLGRFYDDLNELRSFYKTFSGTEDDVCI